MGNPYAAEASLDVSVSHLALLAFKQSAAYGGASTAYCGPCNATDGSLETSYAIYEPSKLTFIVTNFLYCLPLSAVFCPNFP